MDLEAGHGGGVLIAGAEQHRQLLQAGGGVHAGPHRVGRIGVGQQVEQLLRVRLLQVGQQKDIGRKTAALVGNRFTAQPARRKGADGRMIVGQRQADLLEVIVAVGAARGFAGGLHRRQQQRDQQTDDGDHHEQLDQGKGVAA
ncbi:MAG: hypothetical protein B7Z73_13535 [Planctomycetia bacterium 21-64-5]|nr:MAG: hypothetical protein B7Z73_13535 [Planctomycetia bacterium 21-64-5]